VNKVISPEERSVGDHVNAELNVSSGDKPRKALKLASGMKKYLFRKLISLAGGIYVVVLDYMLFGIIC
jgi:hypothetical protein